ncbi:MAG: excinuclease ABC subunit UvrC, partial [Leptolyngbyaceae bacterium]|nr:excinuclease ABC subunit UvrC [Leptolyngbyaceae bacterium]
AFLSGKSREVQNALASEMHALSEAMEFEKAAAMRDRIKALTRVQQEQNIHASTVQDADVIAFTREGAHSVATIFFYRAGMHFGHQSRFPKHAADASDDEILTAFIAQFYQSNLPPREILLNMPLEHAALLEDALSLTPPYRVKLHTPQRGDKRDIVAQAEANASAALHKHIQQKLSDAHQMKALVEALELKDIPQRIEVYDNSHIMGTNALGAMIVSGPEGFIKKDYRQFNIKDVSTEPGDDYGMMREVFRRRFARLKKDDPERSTGIWPDLVLIDGGLGQLNAVTGVFEELGLDNITYVAIAKGPDRNAGRETFFIPNRQPFTLPPGHPALYYLQRLRDEAHRFAIGSHRKKRAKSLSTSSLDDIPGIGTTRKRALLHYFGSASGVEKATLSELEKVDGISTKTAQEIYDFYHS